MIVLKTPGEIELLRVVNRAVAEVLKELEPRIVPGITTLELDETAEELLYKRNCTPAFKGYKGYPKSICASVNDEVVHGIPSKKRLKQGDVISIDLGAKCNGFYGDMAITYAVGKIPEQAERLIEVSRKALENGISEAKNNNRLGDISSAIQRTVEKEGFSIVKFFVGHGIGRELHEMPQIPNFGVPGKGVRLKSGMVFAIEPMVNAGGSDVEILEDGWTAVTKDGSLSAHFEHTIVIKDNGPEILTTV